MITQNTIYKFINGGFEKEFFDRQIPQVKGWVYEYFINWKYKAQKPKLDLGIDGIMFKNIGIQSKYREKKPFTQKDIDYFACCLKRENIKKGLFITNFKRKNNLRDFIKELPDIEIIYEEFITQNDFYEEFKKYIIKSWEFEQKIEKFKLVLRDYQKNAMEFIRENWKNNEIFISLPCGTGKSYIKLKIIQLVIKNVDVVIFFPSKYLINQFIFLLKSVIINDQSFWDLYTVEVNMSEKTEKNNNFSKNKIILSTYQSGQKLDLKNSLLIFDEAHHCEAKVYNLLTQNLNKKIYFSATFKKSQCEKLFKLGFEEAIDRDLICDFDVEVWKIEKQDVEYYVEKEGNEEYFLTCLELDKSEFNNCVVYCNTLEKALLFKKICSFYQWEKKRKIFYIEGSYSLKEREIIFKELEENGGILIVCKVLSEGINLPFLESICFLDTKYSEIEITQCIGRILRKSKNKIRGKVILPLHWQGNFDFSTLSNFFHVVQKLSKKTFNSRLKIREKEVTREFSLEEFKNCELILMKRKEFNEEKWINIIEEFVKENERLPKREEIFNNYKIGNKYSHIKKNPERWLDLFKNEIIINDLKRKSLKEIIPKEKWILLLEEFVQINNRIPICKEVFNNYNIGSKYVHIKNVPQNWINLFKNEIIINDLKRKSLKEKEIKIPREKWILLLEEFVQINNRLPIQKEVFNNYKIGQKYADIKNVSQRWINLFKNEIIINDLKRKSLKEKIPQEKWILLLEEFVQINNRLPIQKEVFNNYKIGQKYADIKDYSQRWINLFKNEIIINDLKRKSLKEKEIKIKIPQEKWILLLEKFVEENNKLPSSKEIFNNYKIGSKYSHIKSDSEHWFILFKNEIIINDLKNYL